MLLCNHVSEELPDGLHQFVIIGYCKSEVFYTEISSTHITNKKLVVGVVVREQNN